MDLELDSGESVYAAGFQDIKGQERAEALKKLQLQAVITLLVSGPPCSGRTRLARSLSSILPRLRGIKFSAHTHLQVADMP